jgi:hypothetical protein
MIFITKNFNEKIFQTVKEKAKDYQSLVIVPTYRGETGVIDEIKSTENVRIYIKEVGRT